MTFYNLFIIYFIGEIKLPKKKNLWNAVRLKCFISFSGHCVICRRCFVKTIQNAVSQKNLPLRCVVCRAKILRLKQTFNSPLAETNRSKYRSKRQTRTYGLKSTYQNNYQNTTGKSSYTKNNKKNLPEISLSSSSKSKCKKRIVQSTINQNNDQTNPIENRKVNMKCFNNCLFLDFNSI